MILNDLERCNSPYCAFFTEFDCFEANYVTVVEDRPIISVEYIVSQFQSSTFSHNLLTLQLELSVIAELLVHCTDKNLP